MCCIISLHNNSILITGDPTIRPVSPVDILEGVDAVISCLEAVLEDEDQSDDDES